MSARANVAAEFEALLLQGQELCDRLERLASASCGLVSPGFFRVARMQFVQAAGELDAKGLLVGPREPMKGVR
jgi:hypothetical protein